MITNPTYRRLQSLGTEPTVAVLLASSSFTAQQAREAGVGFTTFTTGLILLFKTTLLKSGWHVKKKKKAVYISCLHFNKFGDKVYNGETNTTSNL